MNFFKKSIFNIISTVVLGFINLLIGVLLSRMLGPDGVGHYQLLISTATILGGLGTIGMGWGAVYFINNQKEDISIMINLSLFSSVCTGFLTSLLYFVFFLLKPAYFGCSELSVILVTCAYAAVLLMMENMYPLLLVSLEVGKMMAVKLIPRVLLLALVSYALFLDYKRVSFAVYSTTVGAVIGLAILLLFLPGRLNILAKINKAQYIKVAAYGIKLNLAYVVNLLNGEIGIILMRFFSSVDFFEIGYYSRALRLSAMILLISSAIGPLLYSKWTSGEDVARTQQVERVLRIFCLISFIFVIVLEIAASFLIIGLYGQQFSPAIVMLRLLSIGIGARFMVSPMFELFTGSGHPLFTLKAQIVNLLAMGTLMVFLIPAFKGVGAGIAFSLSNIITLVYGCVLASRQFEINWKRCLIISREDVLYFRKALRA